MFNIGVFVTLQNSVRINADSHALNFSFAEIDVLLIRDERSNRPGDLLQHRDDLRES